LILNLSLNIGIFYLSISERNFGIKNKTKLSLNYGINNNQNGNVSKVLIEFTTLTNTGF